MSGYTEWIRQFEDEREHRRIKGDPPWEQGSSLDGAIRRSVQRFQVGEDGDGANLIGKADGAGDGDYAEAVRLFVAEEQNPQPPAKSQQGEPACGKPS